MNTNPMTTRTKPFDPSAVKAGETKLIHALRDPNEPPSTYVTNDAEYACVRHQSGSLDLWLKHHAKIIEPTRIVPHDMASWPCGKWIKEKSTGCKFFVHGVTRDRVYIIGTSFRYDEALQKFDIIEPDGTTSPCGREEGEGV